MLQNILKQVTLIEQGAQVNKWRTILKIEYFKKTDIIYFRRIGKYGSGNLVVMEQIKNYAKNQGLFENSTILAIAQDNPQFVNPEECRFDACLCVSSNYHPNDIQGNLYSSSISAGKYVVFLIEHTSKAIEEFYANILKNVNKYDLKLDNKPIIERYRQQLVDRGKCEIMLPIK